MDTPAIMEEKLLVLDGNCKVTCDNQAQKLIKIEADQCMGLVVEAVLNDSQRKTTDDDNKENENGDEDAEQ